MDDEVTHEEDEKEEDEEEDQEDKGKDAEEANESKSASHFHTTDAAKPTVAGTTAEGLSMIQTQEVRSKNLEGVHHRNGDDSENSVGSVTVAADGVSMIQ